MTINSTTRKAGPFVGNGTVSAFPFGFKVFQASDLFVVRLNVSAAVEQTLVLNSDYSVTLNPDQNSNPGGVVTLSSALASGYTLTLTSDVPDTQPTDLTNQGGFYPEVINDALDRATIQIQQVQVDTDRTIKSPISLPAGVDMDFPLPEANQFIAWNSTGTALVNADASSLASIVAYATAYTDTFNGDGITSTFSLTSPPATIRNLDVSINGVTQVPVADYNLAGQALTFGTAPPLGSVVLVKYWQALPNSSGAAQDFTLTPNGYTTAVDVQEGFDDLGSSAGTSKIGFLQAGTGAQARSAQDKLREYVSVKDFGAVGDGVTDDTAAIQAAVAAVGAMGGGTVNFVNGETYLVSDITLLPTNVTLLGNGCTISVNPLNYTGGITQFFGVFSTVNITARPLTLNWRIGSGTISFENIIIDGFTFNLNRNGGVLSAGQMLVSEINAVRFEDARNCKLTNCSIIDAQTLANNNQSQVVMIVRSETCEISSCYATNVGFLWSAESTNCVFKDNSIPISAGTCIETVGGSGYVVDNNYSGTTWKSVSSFGVNSLSSIVRNNRVAETGLTGITLGHSGTSSYGVSTSASYSLCENNYLQSGGATTANHGYTGILVQNGTGIRIEKNTVLSLRKTAGYTDRNGAVLIQPVTAADCKHIQIVGNFVDSATSAAYIASANSVVIKDNYATGCNIAYAFEVASVVPSIDCCGNFVESCTRAISFANGTNRISENRFVNISDATYSFNVARGNIDFSNNYLSECGEMFASIVKSFKYTSNSIERATPLTRAVNLDNASTAGTATIDLIEVHGNYHPGATDTVRITNVLGQSTRLLNNTFPIQLRTTSYNVGSLPTSSAGLSAGDLWNDTGTVKVV